MTLLDAVKPAVQGAQRPRISSIPPAVASSGQEAVELAQMAGLQQEFMLLLYGGTLPGKTVIVVANLKPAVIRGVESNGMLLAASIGKELRLVTVEGDLPGGAVVK